jgi:16S rRNA (cytosine1402-N4)-methyltransferase
MEGPLLRPLPFWRQRSGGLTVDQATPPYHVPVLLDTVVDLFRPVAPGWIVDATFGGGGHSRGLLETPGIRVLAIDRDPDAAPAPPLPSGLRFVAGNFADLETIVAGASADGESGDHPPADGLAGVLLDLGVSSHQLDVAGRGFSYRLAGPLDMRMGPDAAQRAAEIVNGWDAADLARVLRRYGEERYARRIADAIVAARPLTDTAHLAAVVAAAVPAPARRRKHPARTVFQAIRIAVNDELVALEHALDAAVRLLRGGGRLVVISYHSLEDRIVKRRLAAGATGCVCPPDLPVCSCGRAAELRLLARKPVRPGEAEIAANPRARSARLRAAEKTGETP